MLFGRKQLTIKQIEVEVLDPHLSGENSTEKTKRGKQADVWMTDVKSKQMHALAARCRTVRKVVNGIECAEFALRCSSKSDNSLFSVVIFQSLTSGMLAALFKLDSPGACAQFAQQQQGLCIPEAF